MKNKLHMMRAAQALSTLSKCEKKKVGAVIVSSDTIISSGFNRPVGGDYCEDLDGNTLDNVSHAEESAIVIAARNGISLIGTTIFVTYPPCLRCATLIRLAGIKTIVFTDSNTPLESDIYEIRSNDYHDALLRGEDVRAVPTKTYYR